MAGIYLHTPFCKTRYIYCDFYSTTRDELKTHYMYALCCESEMWKEHLKGESIEAIYFGGETPFQLEEADFKYAFKTIWEDYGTEHYRRITLETNPDDLFQEYLRMLSSLLFNRINMGIQTFDDTTFRLLERRYSPQAAIEAACRCRKAGFQNISVDLTYGLPGETKERRVNDLRQVIRLDAEHTSAYHLTYEEDTLMYNMLKQHQIEEVDGDFSLQPFTLLIEHLQNTRYEYYETSNFRRPDRYSRYNISYWGGVSYPDRGPSTHLFSGIARERNVSSIDLYIKDTEGNQRSSKIESLDQTTRYSEFIITTICTVWGTPIEKLEREFSDEL